MEQPVLSGIHALSHRRLVMTLREAYDYAGRKKKGLIIDGQIGGRQKDPRLVDFINKNASREVGLGEETLGFVIVRLKRGRTTK